MKWFPVLLTVFLALNTRTDARNAADLKRDLLAITGGRRIKLAYMKCQSTGWKEFAVNAVDGSNSVVVYVVDSEDGVIRRLYPAAGSGKFFQINITADGNRVFFHDKEANRMVVVPWSGGTAQVLNVGGRVEEYWRNPADGTHWAIVSVNGISRVNLDNPTQRIVLASNYDGGDGTGLSDDGKKLLVYGDRFGLFDVEKKTTTWGKGGCQGSMRAGLPYRYGHNIDHAKIYSFNEGATSCDSFLSGKRVNDSLKSVARAISCGPYGATNEGARYTQDRDFVTFFMSQSSVNPILMRLTPGLPFVYIEDGLDCRWVGDMDAVIFGGNNVIVPRKRAHDRGPVLAPINGSPAAFGIDGRRITPGRTDLRGIVLLPDRSRMKAVLIR